jgi:hypothetical protein
VRDGAFGDEVVLDGGVKVEDWLDARGRDGFTNDAVNPFRPDDPIAGPETSRANPSASRQQGVQERCSQRSSVAALHLEDLCRRVLDASRDQARNRLAG